LQAVRAERNPVANYLPPPRLSLVDLVSAGSFALWQGTGFGVSVFVVPGLFLAAASDSVVAADEAYVTWKSKMKPSGSETVRLPASAGGFTTRLTREALTHQGGPPLQTGSRTR
jgi:hypothetical protein